jgi:hypothetical protein
VLDPRAQLLRAALGFAGLPKPSYDRALWALRTWLDSWSGIGRVAVGMAVPFFDRPTVMSPLRTSTSCQRRAYAGQPDSRDVLMHRHHLPASSLNTA